MASPNVRHIEVNEPEQMQLEITRLVSEGFTVANQNDRSVTLVKRKQFSVPMLVVGFLLCIIPLLVYLIMYAFKSDQIVEIRLVDKPASQPYRASDHIAVEGAAVRAPENAPMIQMSPDGDQWWDGSQWQDTATSYPLHAFRNPDASEWWDGQAWRQLPRS